MCMSFLKRFSEIFLRIGKKKENLLVLSQQISSISFAKTINTRDFNEINLIIFKSNIKIPIMLVCVFLILFS